MGSSMLQVPEAMISLDLLMAASSFVDKWGLVDVGQLGPAARLGWFIPGRTGARGRRSGITGKCSETERPSDPFC